MLEMLRQLTCISFHPRLPQDAPTSFHALLLLVRSSSRKLVASCDEAVVDINRTRNADTRRIIQQLKEFMVVVVVVKKLNLSYSYVILD